MTLSDIFLSITTGVISSLIFIALLYKLRPNIEISKEISERIENGIPTYGFKMINRSLYPILDVKIELELITPEGVSGGYLNSISTIPLINGNFFIVGKFNKKDADANYAFRVRTVENLRSIWISESQYIRVNLVGRHALSGFYGVFQQRFYTKGEIKPGAHKFGASLDVGAIG